ncbi:zinc finger and SCAN domain-containing protein 23-like [Hemicordylus capensis]|uniref:zinc finger and SCAN domain-containing protein 23-like n=1 Tax=Hemicordylus capensis TaxID=884348 RepID=UPI0023022A07|nr:zinc finger and SCAN domain-containing protein 23-like [Hemicordylus capensis]
MEKENPAQWEPGERSEGEGRIPHVVHSGTMGEICTGAAPQPVKQEAEEGLQQGWEAQWQEFLKTMESPHSEWRHTPRTMPGPQEDTKVFQPTFHGTADASQWPRGEQVTQIVPGHNGEVPEAYKSLDYSGKIKEEILEEEDSISLETRRQHFRRFCYQEAKGPREVFRQLQELCHRWLKPEKHTKERILELLILEQFLTILPQEMQSWVREHGPETSNQAVTLAGDFLLRMQESEAQEEKMLRPLEKVFVNSSGAQQEPPSTTNVSHFVQAVRNGDRKENSHLQPEMPEQVELNETALENSSRNVLQIPDMEETPGSECYGSHPERTEEKAFISREGEKPYKCLDCGKTFHWKANLTTHEKTHTGQKPYSCSVCGKSFYERSYLNKHERIHTGERPYACSACGKSFNRRGNLMRHERTHTGEKLSECLECGKRLSQKSCLRAHQRIHTGEKPYECSRCGKSFRYRTALCRHQKIHEKETIRNFKSKRKL